MGQGVDFLQLPNGDFCVKAGGFEVGVSKQLLDVADIGSVLKHEGGAGVAEQVAASLAA